MFNSFIKKYRVFFYLEICDHAIDDFNKFIFINFFNYSFIYFVSSFIIFLLVYSILYFNITLIFNINVNYFISMY